MKKLFFAALGLSLIAAQAATAGMTERAAHHQETIKHTKELHEALKAHEGHPDCDEAKKINAVRLIADHACHHIADHLEKNKTLDVAE